MEALQRESHIQYLLDVLLYGTAEEKKALVAEQRKEVIKEIGYTDEQIKAMEEKNDGLFDYAEGEAATRAR